MLYGEVNKLLIVSVAASHAGLGSNIDDAGVMVKLSEYVGKGQLVKRQSDCDFWIRQNSGQLVAHRLGSQPVEFLFGECLAHGFGGWVVEEECVQNDIGVQNDGLGLHLETMKPLHFLWLAPNFASQTRIRFGSGTSSDHVKFEHPAFNRAVPHRYAAGLFEAHFVG